LNGLNGLNGLLVGSTVRKLRSCGNNNCVVVPKKIERCYRVTNAAPPPNNPFNP